VDEGSIRLRYEALAKVVDERMRRLFAGAEALAIGRGGQAMVARATGLSRGTVQRGMRELQAPEGSAAKGRVRRPGGGRKRTVVSDPSLREDLDRLVEPTSRGDPESPLRWTCKSVRKLAEELRRVGHKTSHRMVAELLHELGYSLQANQKTLEGSNHPDRNAQFEHLNGQVQRQLVAGQPVVSVDTKKKELVGPFKNGGRELRPKGKPEKVKVHDFLIPELGRVSPYGVYDIAQNEALHRGLRGGEHPSLVAEHGPAALPRGPAALNHGGLWRLQRLPGEALETRIAEAGGRDAPRNLRLPPAARDKQVEQDRTPSLFRHQSELAGQAAGQP
jgi:transposase